jgi:hypothetical protein
LDGFLDHVFSENPGLILSCQAVVIMIKEELSCRSFLSILFEKFKEIGLKSRVSGLCSLSEPFDDSLTSHFKSLFIIIALSVFVLEDFLFNQIVSVLMRL